MIKRNSLAKIKPLPVLAAFTISLLFLVGSSCGNRTTERISQLASQMLVSSAEDADEPAGFKEVNALLISPGHPKPGEGFRVLTVGSKSIKRAQVIIHGASGTIESRKNRSGNGLPCWRIDEFIAGPSGEYEVSLILNNQKVSNLRFSISSKSSLPTSKAVWKSERSWGAETEALYSAWINALFYDSTESTSWTALDQVMQNKDQNFLYNYLSLNEDNPAEKTRIIMQPDCADNPFYLRAYFAWKLGLPFGYHECDRGSLGRVPKPGRLITNDSQATRTNPVLAFNAFLRRVMDGVHSGTARTALNDENSDYYPVPLTRSGLRPGVVVADPYGHTLLIVKWIQQSENKPGKLLAVDAQPDGTIGIKRFWKGNFLFNTSEVVGEPGFKAFRPIISDNSSFRLSRNKELSAESGLIPFSPQQKGMISDVFYHTMEQIINPIPLDPETALMDLINALHEQLLVRITSVSVGEAYMKAHPGAVIPMPSGAAGVFQTGGQWEDFSTPNRDLRLLIAMDAVLDFPGKIANSPNDYKISPLQSPTRIKRDLEDLLAGKLSELSITYTRSNGVDQKLTIAEILKRREAFEMGYNPNDGIEIRWGAPENSEERSTCLRHVPLHQQETMRSVRVWFQKRLHPPT